MLGTSSDAELLARVNDTRAAFDEEIRIHEAFERQARATPGATAVVGDGFSCTYAELEDRANRLATLLRAKGVGRDALVAVRAERSLSMLVAVLAVLKAGGAYLPIDPAYPRARQEYLLTDSRARVLLEKAPQQRSTGGDLPEIDTGDVEVIDLDAPTAQPEPEPPAAVEGDSRDLAYVIYTSGSTGQPKGVMVEHRSVINRLAWMQRAYPIAPGDVILHKTPTSFDVSVWELFWWMIEGATVCLLPPGGEKDPDAIVTAVQRHRVTIMHFVPAMLGVFLDYVGSTDQASRLRGLRRVFASGEALGAAQVRRFHALLGHAGTALVNLYGPTEATVDVTHFDCTAAAGLDRIPLGRPIDNTRLYVVDEQLRVLPPGTPGELCIAGVGLARGYLHRPELTAEKFVRDPFPGEERIYRTGDLAELLPSGDFGYLGRIDHQVKIRGYRIELGEIEHRLGADPAVRDAVVTVRTDEEGVPTLCGYVRLSAARTAEQLRDHVAAALPGYMVPDHIVELDAFPLLPNGKVDRNALPAPAAEQPARAPYAPPRDDTEAVLCGIWEFVLGQERVGVHDNFFALGGNSIHFITVLAKANAAGLSCTFQQMFQYPTIAELAAVIEGATGTAPQGPAEPRERPYDLLAEEDRGRLPADAEDAYPLSQLQAGLIFQSELANGSAQYHDIFSYDIQASFDADAFEAAVREMVRRHPILRTSYHLTGFSESIQIVHRDVPPPLEVVDLRDRDEQEQRHWHAQWLERERAHRFQWSEPGLIRLHVHVLSDERYRYSISFHDSAVDGWSITLIHTTLFTTYYRIRAGDPVTGPDQENHLRHYIAMERAAIASPDSAAYWARVLGEGAAAPLPHWDASGTDRRGVVIQSVPLPDGLSDRVKALAAALSVPVKNVLLAAHVKVLAALTSEDAVLTGYEHSGRPEREGADQAIGLFLNTVPYRVRVAGGSWSELVHRVRDTETELLPHRRYPMAQMKQDVRAPGGPLFESVFNFTHFYPMRTLRELPEFSLLDISIETETEFPLRAEFSQHYATDEVLLSLHYHANRFSEGYAERIGGYYARALELMTADPDRAHDSAPLLSGAELQWQLHGLRGAERALPPLRAHELFEEQVRSRPDATAVTHRGTSLTYRELNRRANRIAHALLARGLRAEEVVAVATERNLAWATAVLGVFKAGGVYLPVEPGYPAERIATLLRQSECRTLLTEVDGAGAPAEAGARAGAPALTVDEALATAVREDDPGVAIEPGHLAYLYFTSGSTGLPKGALCEHAGMVNHLYAKIDDMGMTADDTVLQNASQCFDISLWQLVAPLVIGGRVLIAEQEAITDAGRFLDLVADGPVSVLQVVPSYLDLLLAHLAAHPRPLPHLRYVCVTGEAVKKSLVERWFAAYPQIGLVNAYGATETSDDFTHEVLHAPPAGDLVPVGRPVRNMAVYLLDDHGHPVPQGSRGEIVCSGVGTGRGYINDPERTAGAFGTDPFDPGRRVYHTGDFGRWLPDGSVEFLGRKDEQVKVRGMRLEIGEIESRFLAHPKVRDAAVVVKEEHDGTKSLAGFFTADAPLPEAEVRGFLGRSLPGYMIPAALRQLDALPLTPNGKIDKKALRSTAATTAPAQPVEHQPPTTPVERALAHAWEEVLARPAGSVGRGDDFFALGGHSLAAMRVVSRLDGLVALADLMLHPVLGDLAALSADTDRNTPRNLWQPLVPTTGETSITLVCVPYAAGNAINFRPLAAELAARTGGRIAVYALELPGHDPARPDEPLAPVGELVSRAVKELGALVHTPVAVWGHCAGAALGLGIAEHLQADGHPVPHVLIGGKLLHDAEELRASIAEVEAMTDAEARQWLVDETGFSADEAGLLTDDGLSPESLALIGRTFRHDSLGCHQYLAEAHATLRRPPLTGQLTVVVSPDDPLTSGYRELYTRWRLFARDVRLREVGPGGHYFLRTQAAAVADAVVATLGSTAGADVDPLDS